jgi:hypothetical protein
MWRRAWRRMSEAVQLLLIAAALAAVVTFIYATLLARWYGSP